MNIENFAANCWTKDIFKQIHFLNEYWSIPSSYHQPQAISKCDIIQTTVFLQKVIKGEINKKRKIGKITYVCK